MSEEKQMEGARLCVTDHKQREKEGEIEREIGMGKLEVKGNAGGGD